MWFVIRWNELLFVLDVKALLCYGFFSRYKLMKVAVNYITISVAWADNKKRCMWNEFLVTFICDLWNHHRKNIVEEIKSIIAAHAERSLPLLVCIPVKSNAIAHDFWNTNSLGSTPFRTDAHDRFFMEWICYAYNLYLCCYKCGFVVYPFSLKKRHFRLCCTINSCLVVF